MGEKGKVSISYIAGGRPRGRDFPNGENLLISDKMKYVVTL